MPRHDHATHRHVHVHLHLTPDLERILERVVTALEISTELGVTIMAALDDLEAEIARQTTIEDSLLVIFDRLLAERDPARVAALLNQMRTSNERLAAAVVRGTPAEQPAA